MNCLSRISTCARSALSLCVLLVTHSARTCASDIGDINYDLSIQVRDGRAELHATMSCRATGVGAFEIGMPRDTAFGTPDIAKYITSIEGLHGTHVRRGDAEDTCLVTPDGNGSVTIRYALSFSSEDFGSQTYAPSAGPEHLHVSCSQWMLRIGDPERERSYHIRLHELPAGWSGYSSLGRDLIAMTARTSHKAIRRKVIGAMRGRPRRFTVDGLDVAIFVSEHMSAPGDIGAAIERIVKLERRAFGETSSGFFNVVVLPRPGNIAGIAVHNGFVCFFKPEILMQQLLLLVAHEMMHTWINGDIEFGPEDARSENFVRNMWFVEGVNEYLARTILRDAGLMEPIEFAEAVNRDLVNLADNPHGRKPFKTLMEEANSGQWNVSYQKLAYYRGALMSLGWEAQLEGGDHSVLGVVQAIRQHSVVGDRMSSEHFFEFFRRSGIDASRDVDRYIIDGLAIEIDPQVLGPEFELVEEHVPSFDPGFDLSATQKSGIASGVVTEGPASLAGLRDGMSVVEIRNANRFSNAWDPEAPMIVIVEQGGGRKHLTFHPHGKLMTVKQFKPAKAKTSCSRVRLRLSVLAAYGAWPERTSG